MHPTTSENEKTTSRFSKFSLLRETFCDAVHLPPVSVPSFLSFSLLALAFLP